MIECLKASDNTAITLEHLKTHLRLSESSQDYYLEELIKTATSTLENYLQRTILSKTLRLVHQNPSHCASMHRIDLLFPPLVSIVSVSDILANDETKPIKRYILTPNTMRPRLSVLGHMIEVIYKTGYGDNSQSVPSPLRHAITLLSAEMFDKRVDLGADNKDQSALLSRDIHFLLQPYKVISCA